MGRKSRRVLHLTLIMMLVVSSICSTVFALTFLNPQDLPEARIKMGVTGGSDGNVYVLTGSDGSYNPESTTYRYAYGGNWSTWTQVPHVRQEGAAASLPGKVYAVGGADFNLVPELDELDLNTGLWTSLPNIPTPRYKCAAVGFNGKVYAVGGLDVNGNMLNSVDIYDTNTGLWSTTFMSTPRIYPAVTVANNKIYVIGGASTGNTILNSVEEYTPGTGWASKSPIIVPRSGLGAVTTKDMGNDYIYVIAGSSYGGYVGSIEKYDPVTGNSMFVGSLPDGPRAFFGAAAVGNIAYVIGGKDFNGNPTADVEAFTINP